MNKFYLKRIAVFFVFAFNCQLTIAQTHTEIKWTEKAAKKWFKGTAWTNGLQLQPHKSTDKIEFAKQYNLNKVTWEKAFAFLRDNNLIDLTPGKHPVDGENSFANIQEAATRDIEKAGWESHRKYIDLQYVIRGKEKFGVIDISKATVKNLYDEKKEYANYTAKDGKYYVGEQGTFFLFFPHDVHSALIKVDGYDTIKKIVIKIRYIE